MRNYWLDRVRKRRDAIERQIKMDKIVAKITELSNKLRNGSKNG